MTLIDEIGDHFDRHAPHYDNPWTSFIGERELRLIRQRIPPGSSVLDFGCGTGRTTLDLLKRGCQVTAFDISSEMMSLAAARAAGLGHACEFTTDSNALQDRTWPFVTCIGVLDYYADPLPLLNRLTEHLSSGGHLVVTAPNAISPLGWLYGLGSRLHFPVIPRSPAFIRNAARQAGLQVSFLGFAFPAIRPIGLTLVVELIRG